MACELSVRNATSPARVESPFLPVEPQRFWALSCLTRNHTQHHTFRQQPSLIGPPVCSLGQVLQGRLSTTLGLPSGCWVVLSGAEDSAGGQLGTQCRLPAISCGYYKGSTYIRGYDKFLCDLCCLEHICLFSSFTHVLVQAGDVASGSCQPQVCGATWHLLCVCGTAVHVSPWEPSARAPHMAPAVGQRWTADRPAAHVSHGLAQPPLPPGCTCKAQAQRPVCEDV